MSFGSAFFIDTVTVLSYTKFLWELPRKVISRKEAIRKSYVLSMLIFELGHIHICSWGLDTSVSQNLNAGLQASRTVKEFLSFVLSHHLSLSVTGTPDKHWRYTLWGSLLFRVWRPYPGTWNHSPFSGSLRPVMSSDWGWQAGEGPVISQERGWQAVNEPVTSQEWGWQWMNL